MLNLLYKISAIAGFILMLPLSSLAQEDLFEYTDSYSADVLSTSPAVKSRHAIKFNKAALKNNMRFKLPNGKVVKVRLENRKKTVQKSKYVTTIYRGFIKEHSKKRGSFQLSVAADENGENQINGMLRTKDSEVYMLRQRSQSIQEIVELDESKQLECTDSPDPHLAVSASHAKKGVKIKADVTIGLLIAYTPDAIQSAGSEAALQTIISTMVSNANLAHSNSHTGITYSLLGTHALSTNSTDDFSNDLGSATDTADGKWDELGSLREEYCADQVSVIVGGTNGQTICGIAWLGGSADVMSFYKNSMYSIISANQDICSYLTFAHELGHNLGSAHDFANSGGGGAYDYSYGFRFTGNSSQQYRTVMAYAPGTRIPYFSNPSVNYDGVASGSSTANNAQSLSLTGPVVSEFYGSGPTCADHNPIPVSPGNPGAPPTVPTTLPATEPDTVLLSGKTKNKQTTFTVQALSNGVAVSGITFKLYYDKTGFDGFTKEVASGRTNNKGIKKITKKRKKGYYMACYSSICSSANFY